jgi:hypothetical protein
MTLKNPFTPGKKRLNLYFYGSVLVTAIITFLTRGKLDSYCRINAGDNPDISPLEAWLPRDFSNSILAICLSIYIILALFSCVYAFRRLARPGMSSEVRGYFIRKHILYVATFIIIWTFFLASAYYHLFMDGALKLDASNVDKIRVNNTNINAKDLKN